MNFFRNLVYDPVYDAPLPQRPQVSNVDTLEDAFRMMDDDIQHYSARGAVDDLTRRALHDSVRPTAIAVIQSIRNRLSATQFQRLGDILKGHPHTHGRNIHTFYCTFKELRIFFQDAKRMDLWDCFASSFMPRWLKSEKLLNQQAKSIQRFEDRRRAERARRRADDEVLLFARDRK
ncbi:MAG: hypothetical protein Q9220_006279 [cf. Caloplaca sp. 1 TL-2023]